jgi:hypothetical protein
VDLFLDPMYKDQLDDPSVLLVGQVKECPREVNGKRYRIEWKNEGKPLPSGLQIKWFQSFIPASKEDRTALQCAITKYASCPVEKAAKKKKAVTTTRNPKPTKTPGATVAVTEEAIASPPPQVVDDIYAPVPMQYVRMDAIAATASVQTSSTISSLSQSTIASPPAARPATRNSVDIDSASDDGDNLDEDDNTYAQADNSVASDHVSDDDDDEDDELTISAGASSDRDGAGICKMIEDIHWNFLNEATVEDKDAPSTYNGPSGLKPRVAESFNDPFECLSICGGLDYELVCNLTRNSNEYAKKYLVKGDRNSRLHGHPHPNITVEEMYHFLGITLRISLSPVDWGGYEAYFSANNKMVLDVEIHTPTALQDIT